MATNKWVLINTVLNKCEFLSPLPFLLISLCITWKTAKMGTLDYRIYNYRLLDCVTNHFVWKGTEHFLKGINIVACETFYITNFVSDLSFTDRKKVPCISNFSLNKRQSIMNFFKNLIVVQEHRYTLSCFTSLILETHRKFRKAQNVLCYISI